MGEFSCIVLDLEWNQPLDAGGAIREPFFFDSEIIEIGALKLNAQLEVVDEFKTFIRPAFYPVMNGDVVRLTKIRPQELEGAPDFPAAYRGVPRLVRGGVLPVRVGDGRHPRPAR